MLKSERAIHIIFKNRLMACTASLACQVSTVSGHRKKTFEKQALVVDTKQSRQAERAVRAVYLFLFYACYKRSF
jgi:hypothetical protein